MGAPTILLTYTIKKISCLVMDCLHVRVITDALMTVVDVLLHIPLGTDGMTQFFVLF